MSGLFYKPINDTFLRKETVNGGTKADTYAPENLSISVFSFSK